MPPEPRLATIATVQQAITSLLTTYEPTFLTFGLTFFRSIAVILIVWHGLKMMFTQQTVATPEHMFEFAKLLLFISFGYALIAYYESPIPGVGVSFSNLITDQAANFANILDARSLELTFDHLDESVGSLRSAGHLGHSAEPPVLAGAHRHRRRESRGARRHHLRHDRDGGVWLARADFRAIPHRAALRVHVLGMAEVLHPVRVHSGRRLRVSDDLRALRVSVPDDRAGRHYRRPVPAVRRAVDRRHRHVCARHAPDSKPDGCDFLRRRSRS